MREITTYIFVISSLSTILLIVVSMFYLHLVSKNACELVISNNKLYEEYNDKVDNLKKIILFFAIIILLTILETVLIYEPRYLDILSALLSWI